MAQSLYIRVPVRNSTLTGLLLELFPLAPKLESLELTFEPQPHESLLVGPLIDGLKGLRHFKTLRLTIWVTYDPVPISTYIQLLSCFANSQFAIVLVSRTGDHLDVEEEVVYTTPCS